MLTEKQAGVLKGMVPGGLIAIAIIFIGASTNPFSIDPSLSEINRLGIAIQSLILLVIFLAVSVGRLAKHRFFTPEDIDGGGLSEGTDRAKILQSLLQNTLEQFCLAAPVYLAWAFVMPARWISVVPLVAITFAIGRILFFVGYEKGAASRAIGFAMTFYPSVVMLVCVVCNMVWKMVN